MLYDINLLSIIKVLRRKKAELVWKLKEHEIDLKSFSVGYKKKSVKN